MEDALLENVVKLVVVVVVLVALGQDTTHDGKVTRTSSVSHMSSSLPSNLSAIMIFVFMLRSY